LRFPKAAQATLALISVLVAVFAGLAWQDRAHRLHEAKQGASAVAALMQTRTRLVADAQQDFLQWLEGWVAAPDRGDRDAEDLREVERQIADVRGTLHAWVFAEDGKLLHSFGTLQTVPNFSDSRAFVFHPQPSGGFLAIAALPGAGTIDPPLIVVAHRSQAAGRTVATAFAASELLSGYLRLMPGLDPSACLLRPDGSALACRSAASPTTWVHSVTDLPPMGTWASVRVDGIPLVVAYGVDAAALDAEWMGEVSAGLTRAAVLAAAFGILVLPVVLKRSRRGRSGSESMGRSDRAWADPALVPLGTPGAGEGSDELNSRFLQQIESRQEEIARELHDSVGSSLAGVSLLIGGAESLAGSPAQPLLHRAHAEIQRAAEQVRKLSRGVLGEAGVGALVPALEQLASDVAATGAVHCEVCVRGEVPELPAAVAKHVFRIAQEALANAVRHGHARNIRIQLVHAGRGSFSFAVQDDGCGFEASAPGGGQPGVGLRSMRMRAEAIGGELRVFGRRGGGCRVQLTWVAPVAPARCDSPETAARAA
jgi:signal transduction histidine kinase